MPARTCSSSCSDEQRHAQPSCSHRESRAAAPRRKGWSARPPRPRSSSSQLFQAKKAQKSSAREVGQHPPRVRQRAGGSRWASASIADMPAPRLDPGRRRRRSRRPAERPTTRPASRSGSRESSARSPPRSARSRRRRAAIADSTASIVLMPFRTALHGAERAARGTLRRSTPSMRRRTPGSSDGLGQLQQRGAFGVAAGEIFPGRLLGDAPAIWRAPRGPCRGPRPRPCW